jgi:tetratricopeptide (TPR) repeat protein/CHAT domain-containing protein
MEALQLQQQATELFQAGRLPEAEQGFKRALALHERTVGPNHLETGKCLVLLGVLYYTQGRVALAEPLVERGRRIYEKTIGRDHVALGPVLYTLGAIYRKQGRNAEAEPLLKRGLTLQEKFFGRQNPQLLQNLDDLAELYRLQGREAEAEPYAKRALAIRQKTPGHQANNAEELTKRANDLLQAGRLDEAEPLFKRALAIAEKAHGPQHAATGDAVNGLGVVYYSRGRYAEAEPLFERARAIYDKVFGREHQHTDPARNLALTYAKQGRHAEAETLFRRVLATRERVLGAIQPEIVQNLEDLADFLRKQGRPAEAELLSRRALAIREQAGRPDVAKILPKVAEADEQTRRGNALFQAGRNAEAEPPYRRAFRLYQEVFGPEHPMPGSSLSSLGMVLFAQGRYAEAETTLKRALSIYEKTLGEDHHMTGALLHGLALLDQKRGRYADAELHFKRSLANREKALGRDHPDVAWTLKDLAELYRFQGRKAEAQPLLKGASAIEAKAPGAADNVSEPDQLNRRANELYQAGRYAEAEQLYQRALEIAEKARGPEHPDTASALHNLGMAFEGQGRYARAELIFKRALAISEKVAAPDQTATALQDLANLFSRQGRYAEAEPLYQRALGIREKALGPEHTNVADILHNLAGAYRNQARFAEAEPLFKRALAIQEKALGPDHQASAASLVSLATLYAMQERGAEAEALFKRALAVLEKALGPEHPHVAVSANNLAGLYQSQGRYAEAEPLFQRAAAIAEKALGPEHPETGSYIGNLAELYGDQQRYAEAEPLFRRALTIHERTVGPDNSLTAGSLVRLAELYRKQGRYAEAEPRFRRAVAVFEKTFGRDHPATAEVLEFVSKLRSDLQDPQGAYDLIARVTTIHIHRAQRRTVELRSSEETGGDRKSFIAHIEAASRLGGSAPHRLPALTRETYAIAQWVQRSDAAAALARMAARFAKGSSALARRVRQRQDLAGQHQALDRSLIAAVGKTPAERDPEREREWRTQLAVIEKMIGDLDAQLSRSFPDYAALANPEPLSIEETQAQLQAGEALYQVIVGEGGVFAWVVTRAAARWQRLAIDEKGLAEHADALRCGLDESRWEDERGFLQRLTGVQPPTQRQRCKALLGADLAGTVLPFDTARAHALYLTLLSPFEDLIRDKHLLVVPHGSLAVLPLQVLLTEPPSPALADSERYAKAAWLIARQPVTVLPSVASLKALRRAAGKSAAPNAFVGFGNPLLTGQSGTDRSAWARQACAPTFQVAGGRVAPLRGEIPDFYRGALANVETLRRQTPLPETADELCAVAASLGSGSVYLGSRATEQQLRELNAKQALRTFRVVHFATHGLIAGETKLVAGSLAEPALLLTPPASATDADDGLLTASEAAQLELDADWVILSACNTAAASGETGAQALSGLARGFLYAGTRALLVSHWYVNSEAAVRLVTGTFGELRRDGGMGRAEALRRAMLAQIRDGGARAHPSYWAPFVLVGEGG